MSGFLQQIIGQIDSQITDDIEVLTLIDNKTMSIWEKRNWLLSMAKWEYITFVDDDDKISTDYIYELLKWIESRKDVICFNANISINWEPYKLVDYDINNPHTLKDGVYLRLPNHLMCWRTELAKQIKYEDISFWEDTKRANNMIWLVHNQHKIRKVLYYYDYNEQTSESIKRK